MFIGKDVRINREIRAKEVRVIDPEGKQLGILAVSEALRLATNVELDLVEVSSKSEPPVCRIMDYGKFKYQQSKKAHDAKKKQAVVHLKEVKMRPKTEEHDFQFKLRHIERFLKEGNKTKVTVVFRGRELAHPDLGRNMLSRITEEAKEWGKVEQGPKFEGRNFIMVLTPLQVQKPQ
ncbi:MAG: translation initiation factor IF-3 [Deltaproteobacteria bacterium RBG_16_47_11]|nr:MAG: translation initiation factor IF-3 [Deltaproteobacteria bacterium RBG_16_47_11]